MYRDPFCQFVERKKCAVTAYEPALLDSPAEFFLRNTKERVSGDLRRCRVISRVKGGRTRGAIAERRGK